MGALRGFGQPAVLETYTWAVQGNQKGKGSKMSRAGRPQIYGREGCVLFIRRGSRPATRRIELGNYIHSLSTRDNRLRMLEFVLYTNICEYSTNIRGESLFQ